MQIEASGKSHPGCSRADNEDRILCDDDYGLVVLCDGMGGHQHGELAAELAITSIRTFIRNSRHRSDISWPFGYNFDLSFDANRLATGIQLANRQIWRRAEQELDCIGMGTTIAAVLLVEDAAVIGNVGDSRVYLFRDGTLSQISLDDTIIGSMLRTSALSKAAAVNHGMRHVLTQAAGSQDSVNVHLHEQKLSPGDVLLLCSDGLHDVVTDEKIAGVLNSRPSAPESAEQLIGAAIESGAPDNVSVIVLRYLEQFAK